MNDTRDNLRLRLSDHWEAGVTLRNDGLGCATILDAVAWKDREKRWADECYEIVNGIDPADVVQVKILKEKNGPIFRGELGVPAGNPLLRDAVASLLCHDTRLDRVKNLIDRYGDRFGPVGGVGEDRRPARPRLTRKETEQFLKQRWKDLAATGRQSNRIEDEAALREHFPGRTPDRIFIAALRVRHVPQWTNKGRRKTA